MLGQVDNAAAPTAAAAELYFMSTGFGQPAGTPTLLLIETPELAPVGPGGSALARKLHLPFRHAGAVTVQVTPIADFETPLRAFSKSFAAPSRPVRDSMPVPMVANCTYIRVRIEVLAATGAVEMYQPTLMGKPLTAASAISVSPSTV